MDSFRNRPIGIFDSGVGGLTVAKSIRKFLPGEDIVYFGDTARVPYGNKSRSTVIRFAKEIMAFMTKKKVKMVVVACNTASSFSLPALKRAYSIPVIGVISPGVEEALKVSVSGRVGVIGTSSTISSGEYLKQMKRISPDTRLFLQSCPLFVHLVETGFVNDPVTLQVAEKYLKGLKKKDIDTLILGCTHYPILKNVIKKVMKGVSLVDSSVAVAKKTRALLADNDMESKRTKGTMNCFVSDDVEGFTKTVHIFLKDKPHTKKVVL